MNELETHQISETGNELHISVLLSKEEAPVQQFLLEYDRIGWFKNYFPKNNIEKVIERIRKNKKLNIT